MITSWVFLGAVLMFLSVAFGAFGAHALKSRLTPELLAIFEVGVRYQVYHALGMFVVAWLSQSVVGSRDQTLVTIAGWLFLVGIFLFSGSLYALTLSGVRWLGAITPLGGFCFLIGWALLAAAALMRGR